MNRQGKKGIGWCDWTWNPITGCRGGCSYCYARKMYERFGKSFEPTFHYDRLNQPLKQRKPSKIFVCSVSDFWGNGVGQVWRNFVYNAMEACPQHTFQILTKQPQLIEDWDLIPKNVWLGTTITGYKDEWRIHHLRKYQGLKFISFEPLLDEITIMLEHIDWVIIGALKDKKPKIDWICDILRNADKCEIPVFSKNNIKHHFIFDRAVYHMLNDRNKFPNDKT